MSSVRAFIAIDIPTSLREQIDAQTKPLRERIGSSIVKWVAPQNFHLTLKFLGDIPQANIPFYKQMLSHEAEVCAPFDFQWTHLGSFPNFRRPRVIWIGIQPPAELEALYHGIESASQRLGHPLEPRPFSPHLTIGRVRPGLSPADLKIISDGLEKTHLQKLGNATIGEIYLYQSNLQPGGSVYTKLFSAPLRNH